MGPAIEVLGDMQGLTAVADIVGEGSQVAEQQGLPGAAIDEEPGAM